MLRNYFLVAARSIRKQKFYSLLNISGLAFGLTACFLIGLYIYDELTFDRFHKDYQNIYRVGLHVNFGGQEFKVGSSSSPVAAAMAAEIPGVDQVVRIRPWRNIAVKYEDKAFYETKLFFADSNFFDFFSFKLIEGNPKSVLKDPHTIVLTPATAVKYFGDQSPIGKIMIIGDKNESYKVTGLAEAPPSNSHIDYQMLVSAASDDIMKKDEWGDNNGGFTYYRKNPETSVASIESKLREMVMLHVAPILEKGFDLTFKEFEKQGGIYAFFSYSLADSHLYFPDIQDNPRAGDIKYVYIMGAGGLFILIIACINFMNLSTARSASRAKEVGLRKTLGSERSKLIFQFLSESFFYVCISTVVAIGWVYLLLPAFNILSGKALSFSTMLSPIVIVLMLIVLITVALLAGSYPAFYLTSFNPVEVLKGKANAGMKSKTIRSTLVVFQFAISIGLIICTAVVYEQLNYMQEKNIGLDKKNIIMLKSSDRLGTNQDAFVSLLNNTAGIVKASYVSTAFPEINNASPFRPQRTTRDLIFPNYYADYDHLDLLKIEMAQGRYFSKDFPSDSLACVINESALREMGLSDPINLKLKTYSRIVPADLTIIGVVKDFNYESFKSRIRPVVILLRKKSNYLLIRYEGSSQAAVASVEKAWKQLAANEPFDYSFVDQNFDELFREEQRLGQLFIVMSGVAIFVACLGLLGLASFTAEQRTKEIGIRKVLGASVTSVNVMLSKEFMVLVAISFVLASALAWYFMSGWLSSFAYRIDLDVYVFLLSGLVASAVAFATVSYHFIKAASANPSETLRSE